MPDSAKRDLARIQIEQMVRAMTGNLIRIVRGAGHPGLGMKQILETALAITAFQNARGEPFSSDDIAGTLLVELHDEESLARMSDARAVEAEADQDIIDGALAIVAARLLGDPARETSGRAQLRKGVRALVDSRRVATGGLRHRPPTSRRRAAP